MALPAPHRGMAVAALLLGAVLVALLAAPAHAEGLLVSDFERGLGGWQANDAGMHERKTPGPTLVSIGLTDAAGSGRAALEIRFHPGDGWANAFLYSPEMGDLWAECGADELSFLLRGDGADKQVGIGLQAWPDDFVSPLLFQVNIPLQRTDWHRVAIPLSRFQDSLPDRPLRLRTVFSVVVVGGGGIGPAIVCLDDIRVDGRRGNDPARLAGPFDEKIAQMAPVTSLPRLGNWGLPSMDAETLRKCRYLGLESGSNHLSTLAQQKAFIEGISSNHCPPRPSLDRLIGGLGLTDADMDQDAGGHRMSEGVQSSIFHPKVTDRFVEDVRERVRSRGTSPWVSSFMISSPVSMYGETHYSASTVGQYTVFSRPAQANFRKWLKRKYGDELPALALAWGQELTSWDDVLPPPEGPRAVSDGIDTRTWWSDFIHWYNEWLDEVTRRSVSAARQETDKPVAVMMGGPKVGLGQGISLGNVGSTLRILGKNRPSLLDDTDSQTLFSTRYTRAACSQYGAELIVENVGPPFLHIHHHYNMLLNILACGAEGGHLSHLNELFDEKHWLNRVWKAQSPVLHRYRTAYRKSEAAFFHSYVTSWYRTDRSNGDTLALYDATNTAWSPDRGYPSWGRALGSPDVVDDAMVEDGGLVGRKLLVIANASVTVTSRKAVAAIRRWVRNGGTCVGFGPGCLAYTVESDRRVTHTPGMAGLVPADEVDALARTRSRADAPAFVERKVGKGRAILYIDPADTTLKTLSGKSFVHEAMGILAHETERAGVRLWCKADPKHDANLMYAGKDRLSGHHLFVADMTQYASPGLRDAVFWADRTFDFTFDPSLTGEAELVTITDSFESCRGGKAEYDPEPKILTVRFCLPVTLSLTMGRGRNGLRMGRHPLLLWDNADLTLRPAGLWDVKQTQERVTIGADGSLTPAEAGMPMLVHGDTHRAAYGRGPRFRFLLPKPGAVVVHVNSVPNSDPSGTSPEAILVALLDGKEVFRRELPDKDRNGHHMSGEYDQDFVVEVPAGEHEVWIDNHGKDWFSVDRYVFRGL